MRRREILKAGGALFGVAAVGGIGRATITPANGKGRLFGRGFAGALDAEMIGPAVPIWSPGERLWHLWYYCRDRGFRKDAPESLGTGYVALATSPDGIAWVPRAGPGPLGAYLGPGAPGAFDSAHMGCSDVTFAKGEYWMWYFGGDEVPALEPTGRMAAGFGTRLGLARSKDGLHWTKAPAAGPGGSLFDHGPGEVFHTYPSGVHDGQKFVVYYTVGRPGYAILEQHCAYSRDGIHWDPQGELRWTTPIPAWGAKGSVATHVQRNPDPSGPKWLMAYVQINGDPALFKQRSIAAATSDDGLTWTRLYDEPIFSVAGSGGWDAGGTSAPHLVITGGQARLYYLAWAKEGGRGGDGAAIGLAIGDPHDLRSLKRV